MPRQRRGIFLAHFFVNIVVMLELLKNIVQNLGKSLGMVLILMFNSVDKVVNFLKFMVERKDEKDHQEQVDQNNHNLQDICDNGTLEDLINRKIILFALVFSVLISGCVSFGPKIDVNLVRPWEGHYMSVQDFYEKTRDIRLEDGESIWVLSNKTLYNLLKEKNVK